MQQLKNKKIGILGYGIEGKSTFMFLQKQGISHENIFVFDANTHIDIPTDVTAYLGSDYLQYLDTVDIIFKSPGITKTMLIHELGEACYLDIAPKMTSQTQLFFDTYSGTTIGVTGTKGKSTTVSLIQHMLEAAGKKSLLVGNVGAPVLDYIDDINTYEYVVYELSSFQIESLGDFSLDIGIFTSLYATHIAEHGGYEPYVQAKIKLLEHSTHLYLGYQVKTALEAIGYELGTMSYDIYGEQGAYTFHGGEFMKGETKICTDASMQLIGLHNRYNACVLFGICDQLDIDYSYASTTLAEFGGLEHRIELVGTYQDIIWYNDAIATTPQATMAAIESFGEKVDTLFYGGIDGDYDHSGVATLIAKYNIRNLVLFPDTGEKLEQLLTNDQGLTTHNMHTRSMKEAVVRAAKHTKKGSIALLSCGSPSFSCWENFREKGKLFKETIKHLQ